MDSAGTTEDHEGLRRLLERIHDERGFDFREYRESTLVRRLGRRLRARRADNNLHVAEDGVEAMTYLRKEGEYADAPTAHIILLNLNLPRKDGREVLAEVKADKDLRRIPVVVLMTSKDEQDILKTHDLHANCFITKPVDLPQFMTVVQAIEDFWLSIVRLPPKP